MSTKIEWTDETWNPVIGCTKVSEGCRNCYAMRQGHRFSGPGMAYEGLTVLRKTGPEWTGKVRCLPERLEQPLRWKKPRRVFVNSMSDLFHPDVPFDFIDKVFAVMALAPRHTFQVLTKRPERMREWVTKRGKSASWLEPIARDFGYTTRFVGLDGRDHGTVPWPLPNVWLGVSAEDQKRADERIPILLQTPAAVRFVSLEPLLGPVDLKLWNPRNPKTEGQWMASVESTPSGKIGVIGKIRSDELHWVIVGGESGPGARPMHPQWARDIRDQCAAAGTPYFFKQWGNYSPIGPLYCNEDTPEHLEVLDLANDPQTVFVDLKGSIWDERDGQPPDGTWGMSRVGKKAAGNLLDGEKHEAWPEEFVAHLKKKAGL